MSPSKVFKAEFVEPTLVVRLLRCVGSLAEDDARSELDGILTRLDQAEDADVGIRGMVIDLSDVEYFGTTMLEAIHILWRRVRVHRYPLVLCNVSDMVREILHVSGFGALWPICATRDDALRAVADRCR